MRKVVFFSVVLAGLLLVSAAFAQTNEPAVRILAGPIPTTVTDNSAQIFWITDNGSAPTTLKYGTDANNMNQTAPLQGSNTGQRGNYSEHRVQLSGLTPGTVYHYGIYTQTGKFIDGSQFQTAAANFRQTQPVRITKGPVIEYLTSNKATIAWSASVPSTAVVRYGTDPNNLSQSAQGAAGAGTRRVDISNLQPNTVYYFSAESAPQAGGEPARSAEGRLQTLNANETPMKNPEPK